MAKTTSKTKVKHESKKSFKNAFPSSFGSHASMIDEEACKTLDDPRQVALKDNFGVYVTERERLDNGLADPNRYATSRLADLFITEEKDEQDKARERREKRDSLDRNTKRS